MQRHPEIIHDRTHIQRPIFLFEDLRVYSGNFKVCWYIQHAHTLRLYIYLYTYKTAIPKFNSGFLNSKLICDSNVYVSIPCLMLNISELYKHFSKHEFKDTWD
jgi:hypothetical protein